MQQETEIIQRCLQGDREAFKRVVKQYQQMVFTLGIRLLGDESEARDVVQETFVRVWEKRRKYKPEYAFSTWIYSIASHLCMNRLERKRPQRLREGDEAALCRFLERDDPQRQLENKELASIVRALAEGLGSKQRVVFTLTQIEGLGSEEVGTITGMDASQIKSNLYAARKIIREKLSKLGYE